MTPICLASFLENDHAARTSAWHCVGCAPPPNTAITWRLVASMAIHIHCLGAFFWTKLAIRATHTAQRAPFQQQAFDQRSSLVRDEILLEAPDALVVTVCCHLP